jgi:hypothetical protein
MRYLLALCSVMVVLSASAAPSLAACRPWPYCCWQHHPDGSMTYEPMIGPHLPPNWKAAQEPVVIAKAKEANKTTPEELLISEPKTK